VLDLAVKSSIETSYYLWPKVKSQSLECPL
jgi:hypothetical protein